MNLILTDRPWLPWLFLLPLLVGFLADCIVGDPYNIPHPIRAMGNMISALEKRLRKSVKSERTGGRLLVLVMTLFWYGIGLGVIYGLMRINIYLGLAAESVLCCYMLAAKCLKDESMKVFRCAEKGDTEGARKAVSMIVGRDTACLDMNGIIRAAVETVAENASDGVIAPIFYMAIGGAPLGMLYKSVNTMDSMVGYKNDKYINFGRAAAKTDDFFNFIPSRLSALLMIAGAYILGYDGNNAARIWKRDRFNHSSPNSAQTESVTAGALGLRLAGSAYYFGKLVEKPYIGDPVREIEPQDIVRANRLMYAGAVIALITGLLVRAGIILLVISL